MTLNLGFAVGLMGFIYSVGMMDAYELLIKNERYTHVIAEYQDMAQNDFYMDLQGSDTYDSSFGEHIGS